MRVWRACGPAAPQAGGVTCSVATAAAQAGDRGAGRQPAWLAANCLACCMGTVSLTC